MDIKKYEVLLNAIDKGGFARASDDVGYTQSGITHMMNSLEKEIGFPLLHRSNKGVQLTAEGRHVLPVIRELVNLNERLNQEFALIQGLETGRVRIGSFATVAAVWLPGIIHAFRKRYPGIEIELLEENSIWKLEEWLTEGFIDLCFISKQPYHTFEWIDLKEDPYLAVLPEGHPFAEDNHVPVESLMGETFLICRSLDGLDRDIGRYFEGLRIPVESKLSSNSDYTIVFMVEQNLGISMLPELILDKLLKKSAIRVVTKPVYPPVCRQLGMAVRSMQSVSPAMERFIQCTKENLAGEKRE